MMPVKGSTQCPTLKKDVTNTGPALLLDRAARGEYRAPSPDPRPVFSAVHRGSCRSNWSLNRHSANGEMGTLGLSFSWSGNGDPDCSLMVQAQSLHLNISNSFLFPLEGRPGSLSSDVSSLIITITA